MEYAAAIDQGTTSLGNNQKQLEEAQKKLATAPPASPTASQLQNQISALQRQNEAIVQRTDQFAARCPDCPTVNRAAADQAALAGDLDKASGYAEKAVTLATDDKQWATAMNTRAMIAEKMGDYPKAAADSLEILKKFPGDKVALARYHLTKGRGKGGAPADGGEGAVAVGGAGSNVPASPYLAPVPPGIRGYLDKASALLGMRDYRGALLEAQKASSVDSTSGDAYMHQAMAWHALRNISEAILAVGRAIEEFAKKDQKNGESMAYGLRANYKNQAGDHAGAKDDANSALAINPKFGGAYYQRALSNRGMGDQASYLADFKLAAEYDPTRFQASYLQAVAAAGIKPEPVAAPPSPSGPPDWLKVMISTAVMMLGLLAVVALWLRRASPVRPITWSDSQNEARRGPALEVPKLLEGRFEVKHVIGEGGMGTVHEGYDRVLSRPVAIKRQREELQLNEHERTRFIKEAKMVASLHHRNIVDVLSIVYEDKATYIVFEHIAGRTLHDLLNETPGRRLDVKRALDILRQVSEALDFAHAQHVIHRDMKPANVMIADDGWAKVMDFGIARQTQHSRVTTTNTIVGTPHYMAPEQQMGTVRKESDVFALGVTFFEMLTGTIPFRGGNPLDDKLNGKFPRPSALHPGLPAALDAVMEKALAADGDKRYRTCGEFYKAAADALRQHQVTPA